MRRSNVVLGILLLVVTILLLDLGGIRTDLVQGVREGWNAAFRD